MVSRTGRARRATGVLVVAGLLAACGGAGEPETPGALEAEVADTSAQEPAGDPDETPEPPPAETGAADEEPPAGPVQHRPPGDLEPDCGQLAGTGPGAVLVFPDVDAAATFGASPVTVEFVGCSDTFEANVVYEAFHGADTRPTVTGFTMGGTLGDWAEFRFEETFWTPGEWRVEIVEEDAEDAERRVYDEAVFTVDPS